MKNTRTLAVAAAVLIVGPAAQAAGPLLPALQARLATTTAGLAAPALSAMPVLQSTLAAPALAGLSPGVGTAAEPLPGLDTAWLDYNLYVYPAQATNWSLGAVEATRVQAAEFAVGAITIPGQGSYNPGCPDNYCATPSDGINAYVSNNLIGGGTRMAGFSKVVPRPPLPKFPDDLTPTLAPTMGTVNLVFDAVFAPQAPL